MSNTKKKTILALNILLMVYSFSGICSKMASKESGITFKFCFFYACVVGLLGIYAIGWQQIIKRIPLTTAFANKAVTVIWGLIWGMIFFKEQITLGKICGALLVVAGVVLYAKADTNLQDGESADLSSSLDASEQTGEMKEVADHE